MLIGLAEKFFCPPNFFDETRWQVIGKVEDVLFVVYTERVDSLRLIMAREASPKERREYFDYSTSYL